LELLATRVSEEFPEFEEMFDCLLETDRSTRAYQQAILMLATNAQDLDSPHVSHRLSYIDKLLAMNPAVATEPCKYWEQHLLLHAVAELAHSTIEEEFLHRVLRPIIQANPMALTTPNRNGNIPLHVAVRHANVAIAKLLLAEKPETVAMRNDHSDNLLHMLVERVANIRYGIDDSKPFEGQEQIYDFLRSICRAHPEMLHQRDKAGMIPLHIVFLNCNMGSKLDYDIIRIMCEADSSIIATKIESPQFDGQNTDADFAFEGCDGYSPLKFLVIEFSDDIVPSHLRTLKMLLRLCPEAVQTLDVQDHSHLKEQNPIYRRLILNAYPSADLDEYHRLNWEARRMAMFLSYRAVSRNPQPTIFSRLRFENKDLVRKVVSFL
jgi:hypothetical protein